MARLKLYAEIAADGGCLLFTFDPPGLLARGDSLEAALAAGPSQAAWLRRLLAGGDALDVLVEPWGEPETPQLVVEETVRRRGTAANGHTRATFGRDLRPLPPDAIPRLLGVMALQRAEFCRLKDRLPEAAYSHRSLPHRKTILEQLAHVAACERWYLSRFWDDLPRLPRTAGPWHKLLLNRERAAAIIGNMTPQDRRRVRDDHGEVWTATKVIRRLLYHEKFHLGTIERDLSLFLQGR